MARDPTDVRDLPGDGSVPHPGRVPTSTFTLLDDQPHSGSDDPLGFEEIAAELANLIRASRVSTPLALGIESGWGMGKSSLMRRLEAVLTTDEHVTTVWFNAWTASEGEALEGLVKSVLDKLDRNILRRAARNEKLVNWARALGLVVADWLRLGSLVNALWRDLSVDPKARNEIRALVVKSMAEWSRTQAELGPERLLVVFVDDLDRCSPGNVLQVFEALKLYLDAPGLVFVVGYDREVISDAILDVKQYSDAITSHHYVEKIIQLVYRLPSVSDDASKALLGLYLNASGTSDLFDGPARSLTIEQNARNPRRIKRFINAFILEYGLDLEWRRMGAETLVRVLIIDLYFPDFARLLRSRSQRDPVRDFRDYVAVREIARRRGESADEMRQIAEVFTSRGLAPPSDGLADALTDLEAEMPPAFPTLAQNSDFRELLDGLGDVESLRDKLRRFSAASIPTDYNALRSMFPSGPERTARMSAVVEEARSQAREARDEGQPLDRDAVLRQFASGDPGKRLEALGYMLGDPALVNPPTVLGVIGASLSAFEQTQALRIAEQIARSPDLDPELGRQLELAARAALASENLGASKSRRRLANNVVANVLRSRGEVHRAS